MAHFLEVLEVDIQYHEVTGSNTAIKKIKYYMKHMVSRKKNKKMV